MFSSHHSDEDGVLDMVEPNCNKRLFMPTILFHVMKMAFLRNVILFHRIPIFHATILFHII